MSVENVNNVDFISIDKDANVVLTISDHLQWDDENEHLLILQNKINAYLSFIETGELQENYPKAKGKKIVISIALKHTPNTVGQIFLERVKQKLKSLDYILKFEQLPINISQ